MKSLNPTSLALLLMLSPLVATAAPANDKFEKATILTAPYTKLVNQTGAASTADALDPYLQGVKLTKSVWYRFQAPFGDPTINNHLIIADRSGVRVGIFQQTDPDGAGGALTLITENGNTTVNDTETLSFNINGPGSTFYVCVSTAGNFDITLQLAGQPNDAYADASILSGDIGTSFGSNENATNSGDMPSVLPTNVPKFGVWYKWTPSFSGLAAVDTCFSKLGGDIDHDTALAVFVGSSLAGLVEVASDEDSGVGYTSRVTFNAVAGTTYTIWVGNGSSGGYPGTGPFLLSYYPANTPGQVEIFAPNFGNAHENQGTTKLTVRRMYAGNVPANIKVSTASGSATDGVDYQSYSQTISFPAANTIATFDTAWQFTFPLEIYRDNLNEGTEAFNVNLTLPSVDLTLGMGSVAYVSITDTPATTAAGFALQTVSVRERDGFVTVPLTRSQSSGYATTIVFLGQPQLDSATNGVDYTYLPFPITFSPGQTTANVSVNITNDGFAEGRETFTLQATASDSALNLEGGTICTIFIDDDDGAPVVPGQFNEYLDDGGIAGFVDVTISTSGRLTGKVAMAGGSYSLTGALDINGQYTAAIGPVGGPKRTLTINLVSATAKTFDIALTDNVLGSRAEARNVKMNIYSASNPCPLAGTYTASSTNSLIASFSVNTLGVVTTTGKVFDGTPFTISSTLTENFNGLPLIRAGASLYSGKGRAALSTSLPTAINTATSGVAYLVRPGRANQTVELAPIDTQSSLTTARYTPPTPGQRALNVWSTGAGQCFLSNGGFGMAPAKTIAISPANIVSVTSTNSEMLKITLTTATGFFTGSVIPPGGTAKTINGILLQGPIMSVYGNGHFVNGAGIGNVFLTGP